MSALLENGKGSSYNQGSKKQQELELDEELQQQELDEELEQKLELDEELQLELELELEQDDDDSGLHLKVMLELEEQDELDSWRLRRPLLLNIFQPPRYYILCNIAKKVIGRLIKN